MDSTEGAVIDTVATGMSVLGLLLGFPILILLGIGLLARLEEWMVAPDKRAEAVQHLLEQQEAEQLEQSVTQLLSGKADRPDRRAGERKLQSWRFRLRRSQERRAHRSHSASLADPGAHPTRR